MRHRAVVVGAGAMGRLHARVLFGLAGRFVLVGVYDKERAVAEAVAAAYGARVFREEKAAIEAADLAVIASPIAAHADAAWRALGAGKHVLVEKPLCARAGEAWALAEAARPGQHLFVGHSERFNPVVVRLRALVRQGDVRSLSLRRMSRPSALGHEEDVLLSLGVHDLDLSAYLTGATMTLAEARAPRVADQDSAELRLAAKGGVSARILVDRAFCARERTIEVITASARMTGDLLAPRLVRQERGRTRELLLSCVEPLVAQATAIAAALDGEPPRDVATAEEGARAIALAEDARRRLDSRRRLDPPEPGRIAGSARLLPVA